MKMNYEKERKEINNILIKLNYCDNLDNFYILCVKLYYKINNYVFRLESKESEKNV